MPRSGLPVGVVLGTLGGGTAWPSSTRHAFRAILCIARVALCVFASSGSSESDPMEFWVH